MQRGSPFDVGKHAHLPLDEVAEWPYVGRGEGSRARGMGLAYVAGSMDLVTEHHHTTQAARLRARCHLNGPQEVGRTVGPRHGGVPHRAGHHDGRIPPPYTTSRT